MKKNKKAYYSASIPPAKEDVKLYAELAKNIADPSKLVRKVKQGEVVEATVSDILPDSLIVDIGYKSEGVIPSREMNSDFVDASKLKIGDKIPVYLMKYDSDGTAILSIRRTDQISKWLELEKAMTTGDVIEATVVEANNGGLICELGGQIRGFIPASQLDATRVYADGIRRTGRDVNALVQKKLNALIGEVIKTRIAELDREKNKIILSEKMLLGGADFAMKEETLKGLKEGDKLEGEVTGIAPFGIFVNAEGLEGLVHVSELSWDKIDSIEDKYKVGDKIKVQVIGISDGGKRVAYSVKRLEKDPWKDAISRFKIGDIVDGVVQRVVDFGAFVRIGDGLNGLIHISEISNRLVRNPRDFLKEGDNIKVKILTISETERHLGLSMKNLDKYSSKPEEAPVKKMNKKELEKVVDQLIEEEIK